MPPSQASECGCARQGVDSPLELKGQWLAVDERSVEGVPGGGLLFLGSPRCANLEDLQNQGLYLSDIPLHDLSRDFVLLAEQRAAEAGLKERFEAQSVELAKERAKSDRLLHAMVPEAVADTLRAGQPAPSRCPPGTCFCDPRCTGPREEATHQFSVVLLGADSGRFQGARWRR